MTADRSLSPKAIQYAVVVFVVSGGAAGGLNYYFYDSLLRVGILGVAMGITVAVVFLWADWTGQGGWTQ